MTRLTSRQVLKSAAARLAGLPDIDDPALESEVLLRQALGLCRLQLHLQPEREINPAAESLFNRYLERRLRGEPLAYILQSREFYGLDFYVDSRVLIPRPETEHLVEAALLFAQNHPVATLADIGTGSAAIAVSLALNLPRAQVYATDISASALEVAAINARRHGVNQRLVLLRGDLLSPLPAPVDLIVANLPYVTKAGLAQVNTGGYEPLSALDGGEDGLDCISRLCPQAQKKLNPGGCLLLEIGQGQSQAVAAILNRLYPSSTLEIRLDLAGIDRVVSMTF